jgi:hypothetical protein
LKYPHSLSAGVGRGRIRRTHSELDGTSAAGLVPTLKMFNELFTLRPNLDRAEVRVQRSTLLRSGGMSNGAQLRPEAHSGHLGGATMVQRLAHAIGAWR